MNNRKLSRVLPKEPRKEALYNMTTLINMTMLSIMALTVAMSTYQEDQARNERNYLSIIAITARLFQLTFLLGQLFLEYKMFKHEKNKMNLMFNEDLDQEVKNSQNFIKRKIRWDYFRNAYLERLNLITFDNKEATVNIPKRNLLDYNVDSDLEVTYTVGEGLIYERIQELMKIQSEITKDQADANYKRIIAIENLINALLPYRERGLDMPTKRRYANLLGLSTIAMVFVYNALFDLKDNSYITNLILPLTALILPLSSFIESYILKETTKRLDLEGFHTMYRAAIDDIRAAPIGVCIVRQLNAEVCYFPNNQAFKSALESVLISMKALDDMLEKNQPLLIKQPQIKQDILEFKRNVTVMRDVEKNLIKLHFLNKSQTEKGSSEMSEATMKHKKHRHKKHNKYL